MAGYPYRPLNLPSESRILIISPGKYEDDLVCSLSHIFYASTDEPYDALSYCWSKSIGSGHNVDEDLGITCAAYGIDEDGNEVQDAVSVPFKDLLDHPYYGSAYIRFGGVLPAGSILCDGVSVPVGGELLRALKRLRSEDDSLRMWVDALCIDQSNVGERNDHVKMMGQIYFNAARVRIWLGEEIGVEVEAFRTLKDINSGLREVLIDQRMQEKKGTMQEVQWRFFNMANTESLDWEKLAEVLDRAWV
jgi:hypothetical protein